MNDSKAWDLSPSPREPVLIQPPQVYSPQVPLQAYLLPADPKLIEEIARLHGVIGRFMAGMAHARAYHEMLADGEPADLDAMMDLLDQAAESYQK